jgi:uracil-DNA glycosylase family 4
MDADELRRYLEFYQDLGIRTLYRVAAVQPPAAPESAPVPEPVAVAESANVGAPEREPVRVQPPAPTVSLPSLAPRGDTLLKIIEDLGDCKRCRLHEGRNKIVFGVGDEQAKLVFVGEGPGADEDAQGIPFVGRAGQLLTQMIENTSKKEGIPLLRKDVYICNVVKCRPPENRKPEPDEMQTCGEFLFRQLEVLQPKAICALGGTAAQALLGTKEGVMRLRGKWYKWHDIPLMVTYHPSYLLRPYNQNAKREAWEDLKKVLHFVYD